MRVIVSLLHHFRIAPDGTVYPYSVFDYKFWSRYLDVFDEVVVFARVEKVDEVNPATMPAKSSGPGVTFVELPDFLGAWHLCFMGSLWHLAKSPDVVIDAVADCIKKGLNLELTILGDGCLRGRLEAQVRQRGIAGRIRFLGQLPPGKAIYDQLDQADIFILPSRSEGLPRSIVEAFARGLPCIGGYAGGFVELLENKYVVKPINAAALSRTIELTISDVYGMKQAG